MISSDFCAEALTSQLVGSDGRIARRWVEAGFALAHAGCLGQGDQGHASLACYANGCRHDIASKAVAVGV